MRTVKDKIINIFGPRGRSPFFFTRYGTAGFVFIAAAAFILYRFITAEGMTTTGWIVSWLSIGLHEFWHKFFYFISGGNEFITINGGTIMEIAVPFASYVYFLRKGWEFQADVCLLLLSIAFKSVGFYSGISLYVGEIMIINAIDGADSVPDRDYMHEWFGTAGKEYYVQQGFYILSALTAAFAFWFLFAHIRKYFSEDFSFDGKY